jgi:tetratricopeptide (TPR) repeat protein
MKSLIVASLSAVLSTPAVAASAQDLIDRAKDQYESAAYEDALSTLSDAGRATPADKVQVEQYRALCLIALGRFAEAERAIAALVGADPTYVPSAAVASPRVLAMVADIRGKELPAIIRSLMDHGRVAYQRKDMARARETFELVLRLTEDASLNGRPELDDVKVVARGFVDLAIAAAATPPPAVPAAVTAQDQPAPDEVQSSKFKVQSSVLAAPPRASVGDATAGRPASTPPAPTSPAPAKVNPPAGFVAAVALQQPMPVWLPPSRAFANTEYIGSIKVRIGADGTVKAVSIERKSHPAYDARLLQVASTWLYKPATLNGEPVESEKVIAVRLQPTY